MPPRLHSLMTTLRVHLIVVERGNISLLCETIRRSARTPRHQGGVFSSLSRVLTFQAIGTAADGAYLSRPPGVQMTSAYFCDQPRRIKWKLWPIRALRKLATQQCRAGLRRNAAAQPKVIHSNLSVGRRATQN